MALTRRFLNALGIEADKVDEIITAHSETVTALKADIEKYKADADKLAETEKSLEQAKSDFKALKDEVDKKGEDGYKDKYEALQKDYEAYKKNVQDKEDKEKRTKAYRDILKEAQIPEKRFDAIVRLSDDLISKLEFADDGTVSNKDDIKKGIESDWSEYIQKVNEQGAKVDNPPANNGGGDKKISRARQIAQQYHDDLYGKIKED